MNKKWLEVPCAFNMLVFLVAMLLNLFYDSFTIAQEPNATEIYTDIITMLHYSTRPHSRIPSAPIRLLLYLVTTN